MNALKSIFAWLGRFLEKARTVMLNLGTAFVLIFFTVLIIGAITASGPDVKNPEGAEFVRDKDGNLNGIMKNMIAYGQVWQANPSFNTYDPVKAIITLLQDWNKFLPTLCRGQTVSVSGMTLSREIARFGRSDR